MTLVLVRPPSVRRETVGVLLAVAAIAVLGGARVAWIRRAGPAAESRPATESALRPEDAPIYQSLLVAADSVVSARDRSGAFPSVDALESDGIPPFAAALLPKERRGYRWEARELPKGRDYVGHDPANAARTAFLLRVVEQEKAGWEGTMAGSAPPRLRVSVQLYVRRSWEKPPGELPAADGWFNLVTLDGAAGGR